MATQSKFQIEKTIYGHWTIRDLEIDEKLHPAGPEFEAQKIYVEQSRLKEKLLSTVTDASSQPVVIFDIGLGAAANSSAAFALWKKLKLESARVRPLKILSFENNLETLKFALEHLEEFGHLKDAHTHLQGLSQKQFSTEPGFEWTLHFGDFHQFFEDKHESSFSKADVIFHDPYSPPKNPRMWDYKTFKLLHAHSQFDCVLTTYSQSTAIRAALLVAGFYIGRGDELGMKRETTQASPNKNLLLSPLGAEWIEKWRRSSKKFPSDIVTPEQQVAFTNLLLNI